MGDGVRWRSSGQVQNSCVDQATTHAAQESKIRSLVIRSQSECRHLVNYPPKHINNLSRLISSNRTKLPTLPMPPSGTGYEVLCPVCHRVIKVSKLKRHWSGSAKHLAFRPRPPPDLQPSVRWSSHSVDADQSHLSLEIPAERIEEDEEGGFEPTGHEMMELNFNNVDGDLPVPDDPSIHETFGEEAGDSSGL